MSTIKLNGASSGSSIIKAPDSGSTNQTFTLPASTGTLATTADTGVAGITSNADATAITIDSSENVGIGVVPEDWHSAYDGGIVQINSQGGIFSQGAETYVTNNVYEPQSGGMKYINTNVATLYSQQTGVHNFKTAVSGSADAAITWTTPLQITADGRGVSQFTAAFWARVNMEGTFSITGSHNVSSVTDRGVGKGTLNFANNLSNANYCVVGSAFSGGGENDQREFQHSNETTWSTSAWDWCTMDENETNNDITGANMIGFGG